MTQMSHDRMPDFAFKIMSAIIAAQELFPRHIDQRAASFGLLLGQTVVDYGCGPGRYTTRFAKLVGERGKVYAVDVQEMAIEQVKQKMAARKLTNIIPVLAHGYKTEIPSHTADVVLALDMLFLVKDATSLLVEFHRILKPDGVLILDDGHWSRKSTLAKLDKAENWVVKEAGRDHLRCAPA